MSEQRQNRMNIDDELNKVFKEKFGNTDKPAGEPASALLEKMKNIQIKKYVYNIETMADSNSQGKQASLIIPPQRDLLVDELCEWHVLVSTGLPGNGPLRGKFFSWVNPPQMKSLVFRIVEHVDALSKTKYLDAEELPFTERTENDRLVQTFYIGFPDDSEDLVFLSVSLENQNVYVNLGVLIDSKIRLSKQPLLIGAEGTISGSGLGLRSGTHKTTDSSPDDNGEIWYDANSDAHAIIIDPAEVKPVYRERYYDKTTEEWRSRVKIMPNKSYFSFELRDKSKEDPGKLTPLEIGMYYRHGVHGFTKDVMSAIHYLEEAENAAAWYHISGIFLERGDYYDEELGLSYLEKAAAADCRAAQTDLAVWYYLHSREKLPAATEQLFAAVQNNYPPALQISAYAYETGTGVEKDAKKAFNFYLAAARNRYAPAILRLSGTEPIDTEQNEDFLLQRFLSDLEHDAALAKYCLGRALIGRIYTGDLFWKYCYAFENDSWLCINAGFGAQLIVDAAHQGCRVAMPDAAEILAYGEWGISVDEAQALVYFTAMAELSSAVAVIASNRILDGKGCTVSEENDKKAFDLLYNASKTEENLSVVFNNLGWMYLTGRGCTVDLAAAQEQLEKAVDLNNARSCFHLATMYEQNMLPEQNEGDNHRKALELFRLGAQRGDEKCKKHLQKFGLALEDSASGSDADHSLYDMLSGKLDKLSSNVEEIQQTAKRIDFTTQQISDQLNRITHFFENDLQTWLQREKVENKADAASAEEEQTAAFVEKSNAFINTNVAHLDSLIQLETSNLCSLFGETWERLMPTTRTSLVSAGVLLRCCSNITQSDFDFSGICISSTSALESELKRIFYTGFQNYLWKTYGDPAEMDLDEICAIWPEDLLKLSHAEYRKRIAQGWPIKVLLGDNFSMGKLPFLFWNRDSAKCTLIQSKMEEYLKTVVREEYRSNPLQAFQRHRDPNCFVSQCEQVRTNYRNPAAHSGMVTRENAEACFMKIIGKAEAFRHTSNINGLILMLYSLLN